MSDYKIAANLCILSILYYQPNSCWPEPDKRLGLEKILSSYKIPLRVVCVRSHPELLHSCFLIHLNNTYSSARHIRSVLSETETTTNKMVQLLLTVKSDYFDVCVSFQVLEHINPIHILNFLEEQ